jgi:hypothetical protein
MPYIRKVKTASGGTAVQIVKKQKGKVSVSKIDRFRIREKKDRQKREFLS